MGTSFPASMHSTMLRSSSCCFLATLGTAPSASTMSLTEFSWPLGKFGAHRVTTASGKSLTIPLLQGPANHVHSTFDSVSSWWTNCKNGFRFQSEGNWNFRLWIHFAASGVQR
mmetsp:Transcript_9167/g.15213  ORF Transcript_9167/g.15213 Transcript_9167/m.15213 type:complete len:113 (-) Transcript_9167:8-346(-)